MNSLGFGLKMAKETKIQSDTGKFYRIRRMILSRMLVAPFVILMIVCSTLVYYFAANLDANDLLYQVNASRDYNPAPALEQITVPLMAINSADDQVNPPELGILEREIQRVKRGGYMLIPISGETWGHGTHSRPAVWKPYLAQLMEESKR